MSSKDFKPFTKDDIRDQIAKAKTEVQQAEEKIQDEFIRFENMQKKFSDAGHTLGVDLAESERKRHEHTIATWESIRESCSQRVKTWEGMLDDMRPGAAFRRAFSEKQIDETFKGILGLVAVIGIGYAIYDFFHSATKGTDNFWRGGEMIGLVKSQLKDPDSAIFDNIRINPKTNVACGTVNSKNSFGGYAGTQMFAVTPGREVFFGAEASAHCL